MRLALRLICLLLMVGLVWGLFIFSCVAASIDAQGAFVFIISIPLIVVLLVVMFLFLSRVFPKENPARRMVMFAFWVQSAVLFLFIAGAFNSPLKPFTGLVMGNINKAFEYITGYSPYAWAKKDHALAARIHREIIRHEDRISLEQISAHIKWKRLCIFGPYTEESEAARVIGFYSATMARSQARNRDSHTALVFLDERGTLEVIDIRRDVVDFSRLSMRCLTPADFPLRVQKAADGRRVTVDGG